MRQGLVEATVDLMRRYRVAGTGIADTLDRGGVARRAACILDFPGGKTELVTPAIRSVGEAMTAVLRTHPQKASPVAAFVQLWTENEFALWVSYTAAAFGGKVAPEAADAAEAFGNWEAVIAEHYPPRVSRPKPQSRWAPPLLPPLRRGDFGSGPTVQRFSGERVGLSRGTHQPAPPRSRLRAPLMLKCRQHQQCLWSDQSL